jgi:hypothetical protein
VTREQEVDLIVQRRLARDTEYRNAESPEHSAAREQEITDEVVAVVDARRAGERDKLENLY